MDVILLERVGKLGVIGDQVRVRNGYARNYLLPMGKALRANAANRARFEVERSDIEAKNVSLREKAENRSRELEGAVLTIIRQSGDTGRLYGSVSARDIAMAVSQKGQSIDRREIHLERPIKTTGLHPVNINLHPEVSIVVTANIARSADEAERQAVGEDVIGETLREHGAVVEESPETESEVPDNDHTLIDNASSDKADSDTDSSQKTDEAEQDDSRDTAEN